MGLLDNKSRIIDAILTLEGRRQLANGDMKIEHVSFSDAGTFYKADSISGSMDATHRVYLEASSLPQDSITFESDDSGRLMPFKGSRSIEVKSGQILNYTFDAVSGSVITGSVEGVEFLKGEQFASTSRLLLSESLGNFRRLRTIGTNDRIFEDDGFGLNTDRVEFVISDDRPIRDPSAWASHVNSVESLFNDPRLSRIPNFAYLPPVNKIRDGSIDKTDYRDTSESHLGNYRPWGRTQLSGLSWDVVKLELDHYEDLGYCKAFKFDPTSNLNRIVAQFFERSHDSLRKLDVIDFGRHNTGDPTVPIAHVFFVGRLFIDDNETHTFVHLFTLVFE